MYYFRSNTSETLVHVIKTFIDFRLNSHVIVRLHKRTHPLECILDRDDLLWFIFPTGRATEQVLWKQLFSERWPNMSKMQASLYPPRAGGRVSGFPHLTRIRQDVTTGRVETQKQADLGRPQLHAYQLCGLGQDI